MTEHYFSKKPEASSAPSRVRFMLGAEKLLFHTDASVFSRSRVDAGSELLIRECRLPGEGSVLDLGCGYGVVGIILKKLNPRLSFTLSDINQRALALAKKNAKAHSVAVSITESDLFSKLPSFDCILSNPPQHAGKKVCVRLIKDSRSHLNDGATLQLVVRHQKGGKYLRDVMEETFGNVEDIGRKSGYHIYLSRKMSGMDGD